jgi:hypothetical protein
MCQKCVDDNHDYTHVSDLSIMMTEAFNDTNGKDARIILNDNAGDRYWKVRCMGWNETLQAYELVFEWSEKWFPGDDE